MSIHHLPHAQRGFGMIEVLVAVLVSAIGIIGIGLMMLHTLQDSGSAMQRSRAVNLAIDIAERIRANPEARDDYVLAAGATPTNNNCYPNGSTAATTCTAAQLAQTDLWEWQQRLTATGSGLPGGTGVITANTAVDPNQYTIQVQWDGNTAPDGTLETESLTMQVEL